MESTIRQFVIGMLILGGLITGCFTLIALSVPTDSTRFTVANNTLNKFADIKTSSDSMKNTVENAEPDKGILGMINGLVEIGAGALKSTWNSFNILGTLVNSLGASIGLTLPDWFGGMILSIVGIIIAFSLVAAWFKWWL